MRTTIFAYTLLLLAVTVSADTDRNTAGTFRSVTQNAASYLTKQINEIVKTVDAVKTDFSVGNLPTTLTPGAPGSDSPLARYLANMWRSSYHSGGIWFGFEADNGYMGFAATDAEVAEGKSQYTYRPPGTTGDRSYYHTDEQLNALPTKFKTIPNYLTKTKPFWKATYRSGGRDCGWASQVSGTSFKPNMYYVCPMKKNGDTVAVALEGRDIGIFSTKLASFSSNNNNRVLYLMDKNKKELRGVSDGSDVVKQASDDNGNFLNKYDFVKAENSDTAAIKTTYNQSDGTTTGGWTIRRADLHIGKNMAMELVVLDNAGCTGCDDVIKSVSCEMSGLLQPFVDDLHGMQKDVASGVVPTDIDNFPNPAPAVGSRWREYLSAVWRDSYRLGGIWMGFEDNGYIGFAASANDYKTGASQSVFIPPVEYFCNTTLPAPCMEDCTPVVTGRCRRFFELNSNNDLKPKRVYRQIDQARTVDKPWYSKAKAEGRFWYIMRATTIGLPAAYLSQPMRDQDGTFRGVLIHQFGIGAGSPFSNSLKTFIGDRTDLTVYVVRQEDGALLATGGTDKNYYDMTNKLVTKAKDFTDNKAISVTAEAHDGRFDVAGSYTTDNYAYEVVPLDGDATANTGWSLVAVIQTGSNGPNAGKEAKAAEENKKAEGLNGGWVAFIILLCLVILYGGYQIYTGGMASTPSKESFMNPVAVARNKHVELSKA